MSFFSFFSLLYGIWGRGLGLTTIVAVAWRWKHSAARENVELGTGLGFFGKGKNFFGDRLGFDLGRLEIWKE